MESGGGKEGKRVAVITGASSGLGALFAKEIDKGQDIDEVCIIARRREKLESLASSLTHPCIILDCDLSAEGSIGAIEAALEKKRVIYLVNCAGLGRIGEFSVIPTKDAAAMIELNCRAAVDLTALLLHLMQKDSAIINIASVAAFQPFQHLAIYAATKAFLLSWSCALHWEVKPLGIHVTAVCPYWIRGTEFILHAQEGDGGGDIRHFPFCDKPASVVRAALRGARRNKSVVTDSAVGALHRLLCKVLPRGWMQGVWEVLRRV